MLKNRISVITRLTALIGRLLPALLLNVGLGVLGYLSASFLLILAARALLGVIGAGLQASAPLLLAAIFLCALLRGVLRYFEQLAGHYMAFKLLAVLRDRVFSALRRLAPAKLEQKDRGEMISVITSDIELLEVFYAHTVGPVAIALLASVLMAVFIGAQHIVLGCVAVLAYLSVGVLIPVLNSRAGKAQAAAYRESFGAANSFLIESLYGLSETLRFGRGEDRERGMERITNEMDDSQARLKRLEGLTSAAADALVLFFSGAVLCAGLWLMRDGRMDFAQVLTATVAMTSSFGPVAALSSLSNNLPNTMAAGERVLDLLSEEPETPEVTVGAAVRFSGAACRNVGFAYDKEDILRNISLVVPEHGITGICGKSGSGKSTLLKLLMRFWDADSGQVRISGEDIRGINTECLRRIESYVTQETFLFEGTLLDNIRLAKPEATLAEVEQAAQDAGIHAFILSLPRGYETRLHELGDGISAGEKQRIGLARALLHGSPFLLLDEPTSNLDGLNEAIIIKSLRTAARTKSIILVSHRTSTMRAADSVYYMDAGRMS
ncbi:ATP-binding cassette, subfamily C [Sporobacter termitidis DSM 10068]|uniref:ATP-binding cassette, subfamily C n=1 Tax=Sporobacter termitidis DSM 10068 TaxID=1123282 RepID=A0A1M5WM98_9FIRM|nr:ABC transporter ATP-binding protein [Sporobacter termitidis]SHH88314.1 ATP-binding cassette, subfamily C [Sporobacter termitidis DSM 10068]